MVTVFSKPNCPQCAMTARALEQKGIPFKYVDVSKDAAASAHVQALGYRQVPVVVAGDQHWSGFRPDMLATLAVAA